MVDVVDKKHTFETIRHYDGGVSPDSNNNDEYDKHQSYIHIIQY